MTKMFFCPLALCLLFGTPILAKEEAEEDDGIVFRKRTRIFDPVKLTSSRKPQHQMMKEEFL